MANPFHEGELAVQRRAANGDMGERVGAGIRPILSSMAQRFLSRQYMLIVSSVDSCGRLWTSFLSGEPGFIQIGDLQHLRIAAHELPGDPLWENLREHEAVGLLAIELETRLRLRINGRAHIEKDASITIDTEQVYFNCPRFIQQRALVLEALERKEVSHIQRSEGLTQEQQSWVRRADTLFISSFHERGGADASHRGGEPGFVRVVDASRLLLPDYAGNGMFQTLGNILVNPHVGLLIPDFATGSTLQITGRASIIWDEERIAALPGAERLLEITIDEVVQRDAILPWRWQLIEPSPYNFPLA
ncbi:pyridoxamine 5'-phosphate oxidase family protein [Ktedonosporobacter rubrisoli]|nr:pyridoxamine 5'-phosphate oxidase family protein [Ktedonosporobacter rubrisoli]